MDPGPMDIAERIRKKLTDAFQPSFMELTDDSARHKGHQPGLKGSGTHFMLKMVSVRFSGKSRVERQREVMSLLADEFKQQIHAFSMDLKSPDES